jgi:hypothetical protein
MINRRILLLLALSQPALAQLPPQETESTFERDRMVFESAHGMRFVVGLSSLSVPSLEAGSSVFTSDYWSRSYEQRVQLQTRFGVHLSDAALLHPYAMQQMPVPGHPEFRFVQEIHWPSARPLTGVQFERRDLLFQGDRLSIRAVSDLQTVCREADLLRSASELDALALLGWRSHSQLVWQLGEPTHEVQWQLTARFDRKATVQTNTVGFNLLRRF